MLNLQDVVLFKSGYEAHIRQQERAVPPIPNWLESWAPMQDCKVKQVGLSFLQAMLLLVWLLGDVGLITQRFSTPLALLLSAMHGRNCCSWPASQLADRFAGLCWLQEHHGWRCML